MFQRMKENYRKWYRDVSGTALQDPDAIPPYETPFSTQVGITAFVFALINEFLSGVDFYVTHEMVHLTVEIGLLVVAMGSFIMSVITKTRIHMDWYARQIIKRMDMQIQIQLAQVQLSPEQKQSPMSAVEAVKTPAQPQAEAPVTEEIKSSAQPQPAAQETPVIAAAPTAVGEKTSQEDPEEEDYSDDGDGGVGLLMIFIAICAIGAFFFVVIRAGM